MSLSSRLSLSVLHGPFCRLLTFTFFLFQRNLFNNKNTSTSFAEPSLAIHFLPYIISLSLFNLYSSLSKRISSLHSVLFLLYLSPIIFGSLFSKWVCALFFFNTNSLSEQAILGRRLIDGSSSFRKSFIL